MTVLREQIYLERPAHHVFSYVAEFANCEQWDSTAIRSVKTSAGRTGRGTTYEVDCALPVGTLHLRYRILEWQPDRQVVLEGQCALFTVTDTITVTADEHGTLLDYQAAFVFRSGLQHLERWMQPGLERMGKASVQGLKEALDDAYQAPRLPRSASCAERCILPYVASFSRMGYRHAKKRWHPISARLDDQHIVITGATSGIGLAAARQLAMMGASLTLVARDERRGQQVLARIRDDTGNDRLRLELADLSIMADARALVERMLARDEPIDVLVNNAGALFNPRQVTAEGLEKSFALLLLSPFLLTQGLLPLLRRSAAARVVNVVSGGMYTQPLEVDLLQSADRYSGAVAYARAKRGLMVLTEQWAEAWRDQGIVVNAMHPGWADTPGVEGALPGFYRLTRRILRSPEQGADTIVWLAGAREAGEATGQLFFDREPHQTHLLNSTRESDAERDKLARYLQREASPYLEAAGEAVDAAG